MTTRKMATLGLSALLLGGLVWVSVPAVLKYIDRSRTSEATMNIRKLFDSSVTYFTSEHCTDGPEGRPTCPRQYPVTVGPTPAVPLCRGGKPFIGPFDATAWDDPTWKALKFAPEGELYFRYTYVSAGRGPDSTFSVRAVGDLDCDGILSTYERVGQVDDDCNVNSGAGIFVANELE